MNKIFAMDEAELDVLEVENFLRIASLGRLALFLRYFALRAAHGDRIKAVLVVIVGNGLRNRLIEYAANAAPIEKIFIPDRLEARREVVQVQLELAISLQHLRRSAPNQVLIPEPAHDHGSRRARINRRLQNLHRSEERRVGKECRS